MRTNDAVLRDTPARKRIAVLGEMLELGRWAEELHRETGCYAAEQGIDVVVGIGGAACHLLDAAKKSGLHAANAYFFEEPSAAGRMLRAIAEPGDSILFKGSRGVHVERALEEFGKLLGAHPDYTAGYFMAAQTLAKAERLDKAKKMLIDGIASARNTGNGHAQSEMEAMLAELD